MSTKNGVPTTLNPDAEAKNAAMPDDRRNSFRMTSETRAVLKFGLRELEAELGDQSRGGFLVWLERIPPFRVKQRILLRSGRGWSKVRVAYIDKVKGRYRVGLQFLEDLDDPRDGKAGLGRTRPQSRGGPDWMYFFGILFFASFVAGLVIAHILFPNLELWRQMDHFRDATAQTWKEIEPW